jgi:hypothetical protein
VLSVTGAGGMVVGRPKMWAACAGVGSLLYVEKKCKQEGWIHYTPPLVTEMNTSIHKNTSYSGMHKPLCSMTDSSSKQQCLKPHSKTQQINKHN